MTQRPRAEIAYAVEDYYDGPESGFAEFRGGPHRFEVAQERWVRNRTVRLFRLYQVNQEHLHHALEQQRLWSRWNFAYRKGELPNDLPYSERVFPEDLNEYRALAARVEVHVPQLSATVIYAEGRFFVGRRTTAYRAFGENLRVVWSRRRVAA